MPRRARLSETTRHDEAVKNKNRPAGSKFRKVELLDTGAIGAAENGIEQ